MNGPSRLVLPGGKVLVLPSEACSVLVQAFWAVGPYDVGDSCQRVQLVVLEAFPFWDWEALSSYWGQLAWEVEEGAVKQEEEEEVAYPYLASPCQTAAVVDTEGQQQEQGEAEAQNAFVVVEED